MKRPNLRSEELAEFVGIMLGDGSIGRYQCDRGDGGKSIQHCVKVTLSSNEPDYAGYVEKMFSELFSIEVEGAKRKNENTYDIRCFKKEIFEFVTEEIGLKESPKWERAAIPERYMDSSLEKYVFRGYFDTDGSVVLTDNNGTLYPRLETKICPSPMQNQLAKILESQGFNFGAYGIGKGKIRIQMNGKEVLRNFRDKIGFSNQKHVVKATKVL